MRTPWRRVASGNFPLYRLSVAGVLISSILQIAYWQVPASVSEASPQTLDYAYSALQTIGSTLLLVGLYQRRAILSLNLERVGGATLATAGGIYTAAVVGVYDAPPLAAPSWLFIMLAVYLIYRVVWEIPREIEALEVEAHRIARGSDVE